ncbi:hypothetical protein P691DRAFT_32469 [Macrolepiota fuliginosa MF-IS2]|uniref:F-box domain-containing protein n=1 Tax=Macrolepiota fuliginosa MF-IS2 TaxID=1400762 RepID=A0A9P5XC60_9AGAR|nr:hypothetical protein P691DRAFT_32469 [Macrolepiota fuliginosa MF-IS2]
MHHCLSIPEIFQLISEQVHWCWDGDSGPHPLVSLACTCRAWSEIALDELWCTIDTFTPLVKCMPRDLWRLEDRLVVLNRSLLTSDMEIFRKYASRVKAMDHLEYHSDMHTLTHVSIYQALFLAYDGCLLPNLEELSWRVLSSELFPYLRLFLSPQLKRLNLAIDMRFYDQLSLLNTLSIASPHISDLTIGYSNRYHPDSLVSGQRLPGVVPGWNNLSRLHLTDITLDGLLSIAKAPYIRELELDCMRSLWVPSSQQADNQRQLFAALHALERPFPSLEYLTLETDSLPATDVTKLLGIFRDIRLSRLSLTLDFIDDTASMIGDLFQIVRLRCNTHTLRAFAFYHPYLSLHFAAIAPLLSFSALEEVRISLCEATSISEEEATQIASSWADIRTLSIGCYTPEPSSPSNTTLLALIPLAKGCSKLESLELTIHVSHTVARRILQENPEKTRGVRNTSLKCLAVQESAVSHSAFVALFLSNIFPNLRAIVYVDGDSADQWREISQVLLPMLRCAKEGERERLGIGIGECPRQNWDWVNQAGIV